MGYREFLPATSLQSLIHRYGLVEIEDVLRDPLKEKLVPSPGYCWLLTHHNHSPLFIEKANLISPLSPFLQIPQNNRATTIIHSGAFRMFFIRFRPGINLKIDNAGLLVSGLSELYTHFTQTHSVESMVQFADSYFTQHKFAENIPGNVALETIKRIHLDTAFPLRNLSRDLFFSPRHLRRVFSSYTGVPLKAYQQIVRFSHCIQQLEQKKDQRILEVAFRNGFSDQTHFNKEFKHFTGLTPKQYLSGKYPLTTGLMWRDAETDLKWESL